MNPKLPSGQKLADEMARMMGWKLRHGKEMWVRPKPRHTTHMWATSWKPHLSYDQCRIVEDWVWDQGWWGCFESILLEMSPIMETHMRRNAQFRCQAAWLAWKESKGKDLTKASKLGYYP